MKSALTVFVIIPAYNEQHSIKPLLEEIQKNSRVTHCIVVDDCSIDKTVAEAKKVGVHIIQNSHNYGTGTSSKIGLQYAYNHNADIAILMDADGQHPPESIQKLLQIITDNCDLVIGSRYVQKAEKSTSVLRQLGTKIISVLIKLFYSESIHDPTSGFRAMNKRTLHYLSQHYPLTFSEPEILIELIKKQFVIKEIAVTMRPRIHGKSSISLKKAAGLMIYIVTKVIYDKVVN